MQRYKTIVPHKEFLVKKELAYVLNNVQPGNYRTEKYLSKYEHKKQCSKQSYSVSLGEYLLTFPWDYFATFTTRYELSLQSGRRLMERFIKTVNNYYNLNISIFWALERFKDGGYHAHGLIRSDLTKVQLFESYQVATAARKQRDTAYIKLSRYNSKQGAAKYCSKYVAKQIADYDFQFSKHLPDIQMKCKHTTKYILTGA